MECDVVVLGGGPGGYPAAIRAAQLGAKVVMIEQARVGGTCITVGCIPTKTWVQTAHALKDASRHVRAAGRQRVGRRARLRDHPEEQGDDRRRPRQRHHRRRQGQRHRGRHRPRQLQGREHDRGRGRGGRQLQAGDHRHRLAFAATAGGRHRRPALRRLDRLLEVEQVPQPGRDPGRRRDRRRVRLDPAALRQRGHDRRDAGQPDPDRGRRRRQGAQSRLQEARHHHAPGRPGDPHRARRGAVLHFESSDGTAGQVGADMVLVATGRGPNIADIGPGAGRRRLRPPQGHRDRPGDAHERAAHLRRRRRGRPLSAGPHVVPRGRGGGRERHRPRGGDRLRGRAALHLHRPRGGGRRADRGAGPRAARRRGRGRADAVLGQRPRPDVRREDRLGEDHPREPLRRAAGPRGRSAPRPPSW